MTSSLVGQRTSTKAAAEMLSTPRRDAIPKHAAALGPFTTLQRAKAEVEALVPSGHKDSSEEER